MRRVYQELGTPGGPHRLLSKMEGKWKLTMRSWPDPGKQPVETSGMSDQKMIYGGRYLQAVQTGRMMDSSYSGMNISGYNNMTKKYFSTWIDSMSTNLTYMEGTASADGRTITQESRVNDPVRGPMILRAMTTFKDDNNYTFEMYSVDRAGREMKMMEIDYLREK
jgi:hypothetical protein